MAKGRRRDIGLGGYPHTSIAEARDRAFECRRLARRGGDPLALVQSSHVPLFGEAAHKTLEAHSARWADSTAGAWMAPLEAHCSAIWTQPVDAIRKAEMIEVFKAAGKQSIIDKLKVRTKAVFDWAVAYGYLRDQSCPIERRATGRDAGRQAQRQAPCRARLERHRRVLRLLCRPRRPASACAS